MNTYLEQARKRGKASRAKGGAGEREAISIIREHGWPNAERTSTGRIQAAGDVGNGPQATYIEIRRREALSVPAAMREVMEKAGPTDLPVLVHRPSRCPWMMTIELSEGLALLALRERG